MTDTPMERIMAALGRSKPSSAESAAAAEIAAERLRHFQADDQVERLTARCKDCGAATAGTWQHSEGGRRIRTPSVHNAPPGLAICPGSFQIAFLSPTPAKDTRK